MKILVVDDEVKVRETLHKTVSSLGYECRTAAGGREALNILKEDYFPIVISDVRMPEMSGIALLKEIKGNYPDLDVIIVTGYSDEYNFIDVIKAGASDFITKPFSREELEAKLSRVVRERELLERRKQASEKLTLAKEYTDNIIKSMVDSLIVVSADGIIKKVNQSALALSGYDEDELIEKPLEMLLGGNTHYNDRILEAFVAEAIVKDADRTFKTKSGDTISVSLSSSMMLICEHRLAPLSCPAYQKKNGHCEDKLTGIIIVIRDMRENKLLKELKKSNEEIKQTQAQLFQASKLATLGEMSTGLAHEINQPLQGVSLATKIIRKLIEKDQLTKAELETCISDTETSVKRISEIIKHIRSFARQDSLDFTQADVNETINAALSLMGEQLRMRNIEVVRKFNLQMPKIVGKPYQLEQVWINLISNALDAVEEKEKWIADGRLPGNNYIKSITVSTIHNRESEIPSVEVRVYDNGIGIADGQKEKVFDPFFTTKEVGKGMGLGLSISYGIIKSHKGNTEVESKEGEWTRSKVMLPIGD